MYARSTTLALQSPSFDFQSAAINKSCEHVAGTTWTEDAPDRDILYQEGQDRRGNMTKCKNAILTMRWNNGTDQTACPAQNVTSVDECKANFSVVNRKWYTCRARFMKLQ